MELQAVERPVGAVPAISALSVVPVVGGSQETLASDKRAGNSNAFFRPVADLNASWAGKF